MSDKRLMRLLLTRGKEIRGGQMLDTYHQQIQKDISCTIRTNINTANLHFVVMEEPQVLTPKRTEFGKKIRKEYEMHKVEMSRHDMTTMEPRTDGVSNTLTSVQKDNYVAEPLRIPEATAQGYAEAEEGDSVNLAVPNSKTRRGRVGKQMANTLDTGCQQGVVDTRYRIRKLTPRECFRLMGVDDTDIDKIQASGISNAQQYKCAGNSIVVDTLYYIFKQAFCEKPKPRDIEQTLF